METNKNNDIERIKQKVGFYFQEKLHSHVIKNPKGFVNGYFLSALIDGSYYWFQDDRPEYGRIKLFLIDIFDVGDYREANT